MSWYAMGCYILGLYAIGVIILLIGLVKLALPARRRRKKGKSQ